MPRRQRQLDQLRDLCRAAAFARAIDLAFEHFAQFGRDDEILDLLTDAIEQSVASPRVHERLTELRAPYA